jgi:DNA-binding XRE family transcriptional regulator
LAKASTWINAYSRPLLEESLRLARKFHASPVPAWACRIRAVRKGLKLNQLQFGKKLKCSFITVSRWERGLQKPAAIYLLAMGKMVGRSSGWYFWRMAGIGQDDVRRLLRSSRG